MAEKYRAFTDLLIGGLFAVSVGVNAGVIEAVVFDVSLSSVVWNFAGYGIDWASVISIGAILLAYLTTMPSITNMDQSKKLLVIVTLGLIVLGLVRPEYAVNNDVIGMFAIGLSAGGYWAINTTCR